MARKPKVDEVAVDPMIYGKQLELWAAELECQEKELSITRMGTKEEQRQALDAELAVLQMDVKQKEVEAAHSILDLREKRIVLDRMEREEATALAEDFERRRILIELREKELQIRRMEREESLIDSASHENLTYTFFDEVTEKSVKECMCELGKWSRRFPGQPIHILLNSVGGSVIDGFALYDYLRMLSGRGHKIVVTALGFAASMAGVLLCAGDERIMGAGAWVMIHEVSSGTFGKVSDIRDELKFCERLWDRIVEVIASRSSLKPKTIRAKAKKTDWYLSAKEALAVGLINKIV